VQEIEVSEKLCMKLRKNYRQYLEGTAMRRYIGNTGRIRKL
jgi:hypothetical protein